MMGGENADNRLIVTITGKQSANALPAVLEALERAKAALTDLQQFVVQDEFTLTLVVELSSTEETRETDIVKELLLCAYAMKLYVEFDVVQRRSTAEPGQVFVVTMISPVGTGSSSFLVDICQVVAKNEGNIETINSLSKGTENGISALRSRTNVALREFSMSSKSDGFICYEFFIRLPEKDLVKKLHKMREGLLLLGKKARGDIAVQRAGLLQRAKRMVVFDLSYTLITSDANELLFRAAGIEEPTEIEDPVKNNGMEYAEELEKRVAFLEGKTASQVHEKALSELQYTSGAVEVVRILKCLGYRTAVISRGPKHIAEKVQNKLGLDFAYGNEYLVENDRFTGKLRTPAVDANRKSDLLNMLVMSENITLDQVIAVGDGPVSSKLLSHAGLSVAFDQPEAVDGPVLGRINSRSLTSVLYLLGISQDDIKSMST